ncbi:MAG: TetR/AcrR family transcriptional regulator [Spirochaetaceae bacterium]|jgi:AcrR family transcriptional regulator|nr:TetR/AcrR family transcriptional regulator [Spirochaetaceae bacterium]
MINNEKSERVRLHFAETARRMILSSGIEEFSARKLAVEAGYSLGTIYNHFSSLDEVLWYTRSLMIEVMGKYLTEKSTSSSDSIDNLKLLFKNYLSYFIEHPQVYRFLYFHKLDKSEKTVTSLADSPDFSKQRMKIFTSLINNGKLSQKDAATILTTIIYSIQGILTMVITDNDNVDKKTAFNQLEEIIDFLTKK